MKMSIIEGNINSSSSNMQSSDQTTTSSVSTLYSTQGYSPAVSNAYTTATSHTPLFGVVRGKIVQPFKTRTKLINNPSLVPPVVQAQSSFVRPPPAFKLKYVKPGLDVVKITPTSLVRKSSTTVIPTSEEPSEGNQNNSAENISDGENNVTPKQPQKPLTEMGLQKLELEKKEQELNAMINLLTKKKQKQEQAKALAAQAKIYPYQNENLCVINNNKYKKPTLLASRTNEMSNVHTSINNTVPNPNNPALSTPVEIPPNGQIPQVISHAPPRLRGPGTFPSVRPPHRMHFQPHRFIHAPRGPPQPNFQPSHQIQEPGPGHIMTGPPGPVRFDGPPPPGPNFIPPPLNQPPPNLVPPFHNNPQPPPGIQLPPPSYQWGHPGGPPGHPGGPPGPPPPGLGLPPPNWHPTGQFMERGMPPRQPPPGFFGPPHLERMPLPDLRQPPPPFLGVPPPNFKPEDNNHLKWTAPRPGFNRNRSRSGSPYLSRRRSFSRSRSRSFSPRPRSYSRSPIGSRKRPFSPRMRPLSPLGPRSRSPLYRSRSPRLRQNSRSRSPIPQHGGQFRGPPRRRSNSRDRDQWRFRRRRSFSGSPKRRFRRSRTRSPLPIIRRRISRSPLPPNSSDAKGSPSQESPKKDKDGESEHKEETDKVETNEGEETVNKDTIIVEKKEKKIDGGLEEEEIDYEEYEEEEEEEEGDDGEEQEEEDVLNLEDDDDLEVMLKKMEEGLDESKKPIKKNSTGKQAQKGERRKKILKTKPKVKTDIQSSTDENLTNTEKDLEKLSNVKNASSPSNRRKRSRTPNRRSPYRNRTRSPNQMGADGKSRSPYKNRSRSPLSPFSKRSPKRLRSPPGASSRRSGSPGRGDRRTDHRNDRHYSPSDRDRKGGGYNRGPPFDRNYNRGNGRGNRNYGGRNYDNRNYSRNDRRYDRNDDNENDNVKLDQDNDKNDPTIDRNNDPKNQNRYNRNYNNRSYNRNDRHHENKNEKDGEESADKNIEKDRNIQEKGDQERSGRVPGRTDRGDKFPERNDRDQDRDRHYDRNDRYNRNYDRRNQPYQRQGGSGRARYRHPSEEDGRSQDSLNKKDKSPVKKVIEEEEEEITDPILRARKKKFESNEIVEPIQKKIRLKQNSPTPFEGEKVNYLKLEEKFKMQEMEEDEVPLPSNKRIILLPSSVDPKPKLAAIAPKENSISNDLTIFQQPQKQRSTSQSSQKTIDNRDESDDTDNTEDDVFKELDAVLNDIDSEEEKQHADMDARIRKLGGVTKSKKEETKASATKEKSPPATISLPEPEPIYVSESMTTNRPTRRRIIVKPTTSPTHIQDNESRDRVSFKLKTNMMNTDRQVSSKSDKTTEATKDDILRKCKKNIINKKKSGMSNEPAELLPYDDEEESSATHGETKQSEDDLREQISRRRAERALTTATTSSVVTKPQRSKAESNASRLVKSAFLGMMGGSIVKKQSKEDLEEKVKQAAIELKERFLRREEVAEPSSRRVLIIKKSKKNVDSDEEPDVHDQDSSESETEHRRIKKKKKDKKSSVHSRIGKSRH